MVVRYPFASKTVLPYSALYQLKAIDQKTVTMKKGEPAH